MTRNRRSVKAAGTRFETHIATYLADALADPRIERRARNGTKDRGDITGLLWHGHRLVAELKNTARLNLPAWTAEAHLEAGNDDALAGIVIHKRHGVGDPGRQWVSMTVDDLIGLWLLQRFGHRKDTLDDTA